MTKPANSQSTSRGATQRVPPEIILQLEAQGLAIVPKTMTSAQRGRRIMNLLSSPEDRYEAVIEEGRLRV